MKKTLNNIVILLAVYNGEKYLTQQIESLTNQSVKVDIIIRDDGSTDNSIKIIKDYVDNYDNIYFLEDDLLSTRAQSNFSILLEYAKKLNKYKYFMFCDQDDVWLDNKVEYTLNKMLELEKKYSNFPLMVFSNLIVANNNLEIISTSMWKSEKLDIDIMKNLYDILSLNVVTGSTIMINEYALHKMSPMPLNYIYHDHWIAANIVKYGKYAYIEEPLTIYRQHEHNVLGSSNKGIKYFIQKIIDLFIHFSNFKKKYSYFDFEISLSRVIFHKVILNIKRLK
ncbi:glycosyltransferase [Sulfurimonas autotrophica]|uniref:Glycosyl transferase family 2 n=1 Tax=Sulfurimonas autotrophica (strain ATCC BAA-671 / DSM 16294 / JCM 11897 / OK10) TaxID=563040 RepID=E0UU25_SULAO|nr:glycosyltransferase [Sulfurimonas autotrophica]ADN08334.1 glycosyl transferase family 2 [Sulfurimonas autotrophica DSM 16294]